MDFWSSNLKKKKRNNLLNDNIFNRMTSLEQLSVAKFQVQREGYMSERFLEAALRPWIDSDKTFVDKKIAQVYTSSSIYLPKIIKQICGKVDHGLAMAFGLSKMIFNWFHILYMTL